MKDLSVKFNLPLDIVQALGEHVLIRHARKMTESNFYDLNTDQVAQFETIRIKSLYESKLKRKSKALRTMKIMFANEAIARRNERRERRR